MPNLQNITLHFIGGNSDKIYKAWIESASNKENYLVGFAFGRRGSTLQVGTKTNQPVSANRANTIFNKLVESKLEKGYQVIDSRPCPTDFNSKDLESSSYVFASNYNAGSKTVEQEFLPQLLNPVTQEQLKPLMLDANWCVQEKMDGKRLILTASKGKARAFNRKGIEVGAPEKILNEVQMLSLGQDITLDGESIGENFHVFDILKLNSDLTSQPYKTRLKSLNQLFSTFTGNNVLRVTTTTGKKDKTAVFNSLLDNKAEGVVLKNLKASYNPGRPNSGGDQLKYKFVKTASVLVDSHNLKRSVALYAYKNGAKTPVGNVTIPQNQEIPEIDSVVEIKYLYAIPESNSLYQPIYLGTREDIDAQECDLGQLEYKKQ